MSKKKELIKSAEEVLSAANAAYDKEKEKAPDLYPESGRVYFVQGWLQQAYERLYNKINS